MSVTETEPETSLGKYHAEKGKVVAALTNPFQDRVDIAKSLFGILSDDMTLEEVKEKRCSRI